MCVSLHMSIITQNGWSALMLAASEGETEVVVQLVKAGANVDMQNNVCQYIILHMFRTMHNTGLSLSLIICHVSLGHHH